MKTLRFEITITLADTSVLSDEDVAAALSDAVGSFADENSSVEDFDVIQKSGISPIALASRRANAKFARDMATLAREMGH